MYYSYGNYDRAILAATIIPIIISLVVSIGLAIGLGFLTKHMNEKKGYTGGFAKLAGPTGGYLLGYIPMAAICGFFYHKFGKKLTGVKKYLTMAGAALIGTVMLYALGTAWFCLESGNSVGAALSVCVIPFLPGDTIKTAAALITVPAVETALLKAQLSLSSVQ